MAIQVKSAEDQKSSGIHGAGSQEEGLESVERAIADLRRGVAVIVIAGNVASNATGDESGTPREAFLVRAAETVDVWPLPFFSNAGVGPLSLAVTGRRASILGLSQPATRAVQLAGTNATAFTPERLRPLIDPQTEGGRVPPLGITATEAPAHGAVDGAIRLTKIARLLPSAVVAPLTVEDPIAWAQNAARLVVTTAAIEAYDCNHADDLKPISEARVPLAGSKETRIVSFRPSDGGAEHLAIVVGTPDPAQPVLTRLHSECFTGDLLDSLRCDCGDQLRGAIATLAKEGGGVLLYLAQEGRGIGLVNKLRAYGLQDQGFDTVDANEQLGFDDDERVYLPAVRMLRHLGFTRVRLLTNNPAKVGALARHGIDVTQRVPHAFPSNEHNWTYLQTKAKRSGHLF